MTTNERETLESICMPFGKYKGLSLGEIVDRDILYLDWLRGIELRGDLRAAVDGLCEHYYREIERAMESEDEI